MMKKLLFLVLLAFVSIGTWAASSVTVSTDGTTVIVYCEGNDLQQLLNDNASKFTQQGVVKVQTKGTYDQNQFGWVRNKVGNTNISTFDASASSFTDNWGQKFGDMGNNVKHIILSSNTTSYNDQMFQNLNGLETVTFKNVVATKSGGSFKIQKQASDASVDEQLLFDILSANGKNPEFVEPAAQTSFENGVLTLNPNDENAISTWLTNNNVAASSVNKVVFADGSVWKRDATDAGTLTTTQSPDTHANALTTAGLPVTTTNSVVALGQYVSIINGSIVQIQTNGATDNNITSWPGITSDEVSAVESAANVKLVGPFTATTFKAVGDKVSSNIVSLDMSESTGLENTALGGNIDKTNLQKVILPNSMTAIPDEFAKEYTALTTVVMSNTTQTIGKQAFYKCQNLAYVNGGEKGVVSFPTSLEVIGGDAFFGCYEFNVVNLNNLPSLWKIDYAAFNMGNTPPADKPCIRTVYLPTDNSTLTFFGNQVFSSTNVTTLNFSGCKGIEHFAYDGTTDDPAYQGQTTTSNETFTYYSKLQSITLPPNLLYLAKKAFSHCDDLMSVTFSGRANYSNNCELINKLTIDDFAFDKCMKLAEVNFSDNLWKIGKHAFDKTHLTTVSIPASVDEIGYGAFNENDYLTTVIFEDIAADCKCGTTSNKPAGNDTKIKGTPNNNGEVALDENGNPIGEMGAFWNCKAIRDVYINNQTQLKCENLAFVFDVTYGHADASRTLATLHFPEKDTEHYANLDHCLTDAIAADPGKFHKWLHVHFHQAIVPKHNGWYEFVNAGPTKDNIDDPKNVCQDIILRTFSDWNYSYLVPEGMRAYVVKQIEKNGTVYELTLQRILAIPAKTGVILYGHPNGKNTKGEPILSMTPIAFGKVGQTTVDENGKTITITEEMGNQGQPLCRANWETNYVKNYLEPTSTPSQADVNKLYNKWKNEEDATKKAALEAEYNNLLALIEANPAWKNKKGELNGGLFVKPFENEITSEDPYDPYNYNSDKKVTFRNFAMSRYNKTHHLSGNRSLKSNEVNYEAFFRMIADYYPSGKAYLRLKAESNEYDEPTGAEIIVKEDKGPDGNYGDGCYYTEYSKNDGAPINTRREYTKAGHGMNPLGWWVKEHGFDWNIVDENYQYQEEDGTPILDEDGNEIIKSRMNWGSYPERFRQNPSLALRYLGELGEDADGIVKLVVPADDNANDEYYTLQGVKVINPTKGVYIHNGKKVVIK